jgi:hypothetical protein
MKLEKRPELDNAIVPDVHGPDRRAGGSPKREIPIQKLAVLSCQMSGRWATQLSLVFIKVMLAAGQVRRLPILATPLCRRAMAVDSHMHVKAVIARNLKVVGASRQRSGMMCCCLLRCAASGP